MYETNNSSIELLECLNCFITPIGCTFISKMFDFSRNFMIKYLILDYNHFGNEGLSVIMNTIKDSKFLIYLSLGNCLIDENGIRLFDDFLSNPDTNLETLDLQGNQLKNGGVMELLKILFDNKNLTEINLNNTQFGNDPEVFNVMARLMQSNTKLGAYYLNFNSINDEGNFLIKNFSNFSLNFFYSKTWKL